MLYCLFSRLIFDITLAIQRKIIRKVSCYKSVHLPGYGIEELSIFHAAHELASLYRVIAAPFV